MAKMGYQEAANIRKNKLSDMIAQRLVEGESIGTSFSKSLSERTKANVTGLKQKVDFLNIAKKLSGGSNLVPALLGRLTGRNADSIRFFSGKGTAKPVSEKATKIDSTQQLEQTEAIYETLDNIYGFLKDSNEQYEQKRIEEQGKLEEKEFERKKQNEELMKLLGVQPNKPTATKIVDEEKEEESFLSKFLKMLGISGSAWKTLKNVMGVLAGPVGGLMAMAGFYSALYFLLNRAVENTPNMRALSPQEARNILENGSPRDIEAAGGRKVLEDIIVNRKKEAIDALAMEPGEAREKRLRELGGEDKVKAIVADEKSYEIPAVKSPSESGMADKLPFTKEQFIGKGTARKVKEDKWNKLYAPYYNDDGTLKKMEPIKQPQPQANQSPQLPASVSEETALPVSEPPVSALVSEKTFENLELQLPKPVVDAFENIINNTTVNSQDTSQLATISMPSVRNQEPTFQDMILYSTKVV